jgi:cellulose synthase/poly-beta-1,6-N-acetylglucosamine synthase-like glycosyltransferase
MSWLEVLAGALLAIAAPGSLYLAVLTLASWRRPPQARPAAIGDPTRLAIIVPAHNEAFGIAATLFSLRAEADCDPAARIIVIADNCDDDTAAVARSRGVEVIERSDASQRGKGFALQWAFELLMPRFDWFVIVDADTVVQPGFLRAMRAAIAGGADALQCRYLVRDALANRRNRLGEVALAAWNVLRPRGRAVLGASVGILGNGFALAARTLARVPYLAHSIVEDVEYHVLLVRAGLRVGFVDDAVVRGAMPDNAGAAATQRSRWEGGRLRLAIDRAPALAAQIFLRGRWRLLDPLLDLLLAPLAIHCALLSLAFFAGSDAQRWAAVAALAVVAIHVATGLRLIKAPLTVWFALASAPAYIVWKLMLVGRIARSARRQAAWVRTQRAGSSDRP